MVNQLVSTDQAPAAIGPYSQAVSNGELLFISRQLPIDPATGEVIDGEIDGQTRRVLQNVRAVLESQDLSVGDIVKVTVFLLQIDDYPTVNEAYADVFDGWQPARSVVQVAGLPKEASIEIDAIATLRRTG